MPDDPEELRAAIELTRDREALFALDPSRRYKPTAKELLGEIAQMLSELSEKLVDLTEIL